MLTFISEAVYNAPSKGRLEASRHLDSPLQAYERSLRNHLSVSRLHNLTLQSYFFKNLVIQ